MKVKSFFKIVPLGLLLIVAACDQTGASHASSNSDSGIIVSSSSSSESSQPIVSSSNVPDNHELRFELSEDGTYYTVYGINLSVTRDRVIIPSEYNGLPVTTIGEKAFQNYDFITEVVVPSSITTICKYAFEYTDIKSFVFAENIKTVEISVIKRYGVYTL